MKKLLAATLFILAVSPLMALAVDVGLYPTTIYNCKVPTEREDGVPFDWATEGKEIQFFWGTASGDLQNTVIRPNCQWVIDNTAYPAGTTLYIQAVVVDVDGRMSLPNTEVSYLIEASKANPKQMSAGVLEHIPAQQQGQQ